MEHRLTTLTGTKASLMEDRQGKIVGKCTLLGTQEDGMTYHVPDLAVTFAKLKVSACNNDSFLCYL